MTQRRPSTALSAEAAEFVPMPSMSYKGSSRSEDWGTLVADLSVAIPEVSTSVTPEPLTEQTAPDLPAAGELPCLFYQAENIICVDLIRFFSFLYAFILSFRQVVRIQSSGSHLRPFLCQPQSYPTRYNPLHILLMDPISPARKVILAVQPPVSPVLSK